MDDENDVSLLTLSETRYRHVSREVKTAYTWYFTGHENPTAPEFAGVAVVLSHHFVKHVTDIQPYGSRFLILKLAAAAPITIIATYAPPAPRPTEEKTEYCRPLHT